jgi:hypothetical protein
MEYHGGVMTDPVQEHMLIVQIWMLTIQLLALLGLIWYTVVTRGIRKASQDQVRVSQDLIRAAMDQVEGLSKPCITLSSRVRDGADTILEVGAVGSLVAWGPQGFFALENIGNGIALNVSYEFMPGNRAPERIRPNRRYVQNVLASHSISMVESIHQFTGEWEVRFDYESIGGMKYQSIVSLTESILTHFQYESVKA